MPSDGILEPPGITALHHFKALEKLGKRRAIAGDLQWMSISHTLVDHKS